MSDGNGTVQLLLTVGGNTTAAMLETTGPGLSPAARVVILISYIVGVVGNLAALYILHKERKTRYKNKKHTLMLRCLAGNDLAGLLGMLVQLFMKRGEHVSCVMRVIWRSFGVSSGCVALVMAVERWLALTQPFLYQKRVTYNALVKAIVTSWAVVLILSCMPFIGFGLYFDAKTAKCKRYRDADSPIDVAYAYLFFTFGLFLSVGISWANLAVTRFLCHTDDRKIGRRISRIKISRNRELRVEGLNAATPDEVAFARLMVALSVTFLLCWLPNMLAIPLAQLRLTSEVSKRFFELADVLMAIHFTLDPYIYVLLHHYFPCLRITFDAVQRHCHCCQRISESPPDIVQLSSSI